MRGRLFGLGFLAMGCSDATIKTFNAEPTATITSHADGTEVFENPESVLTGTVADTDHPTSDLLASWTVDEETACSDLVPDDSGEVTCITALTTGPKNIILVVTDPGSATGRDSVSLSIIATDPPDVNLVSPYDGERYRADESIEFRGTVFDEDDGISVTTWLESSLQGRLEVDITLDAEGAFESYGNLEEGEHIITLWAEDSAGKPGKDSHAITVLPANDPPSIDSVEITPDPAYAIDTLTCVYSGYSDPNNDPDESIIQWTVNGASAGEGTLLEEGFAAGDAVSCTVIPSDGEDEGAALSASIVISNSVPSLENAEITPDPAYAADTLTCTATGFDDADGDENASTFAWSINGVDAGAEATLEGGFVSGDEVTCTVTPNDGTEDGEPVSDTIVIGDSAPRIETVEITPDPAQATDTLTCSYTGFADDDGGADASTFAWTVNGTAAGTESTLADAFVGGDTVICTVTPFDGSEAGTPVSDDIVIGNTGPAITSVEITPDTGVTTSTDLSCEAEYEDADGETLTITYTWTNAAGDPLGIGEALSLTPDTTAPDDVITCTARVTDGDGEEASDTDSVTVGNSGPAITSVEITPDTGVTTSTDLSCEAEYEDADGETLTITYTWTNAAGDTLGTGDSLSLTPDTTAPDDVITCTASVTDGGGDTDSGTDAVTVGNTAPTVTSVEITPDTGVTTSSDLSCNATYEDADGETLTITYTWTNGDGDTLDTGDSLTLDPLFVAPGDVITCAATVVDAAGDSSTATDWITVGNTAPTVTLVEITPDTGVTMYTVLTCNAAAEDDDGSVPTITYAWDIEGSFADTGDTLDLATTAGTSGDTVTCTATATDGTDEATGTDSVLIENTAPEIDSVVLTPDEVYTNDTITAAVTTSDAEGETVSVNIDWYVEGSLVASGSATTLSGVSYFDKHDEVYVVATPNDGTEDGSPVTSDILTVLNTPPSAPGVSIAGEAGAICPDGWSVMDDEQRCVQVVEDTSITWADANSACVSTGGHLVRIASAADNDQIVDLAVSAGLTNEHLWIGYQDIDSEGDWVWTDGQPTTYENWRSGAPYAGDGSYSDCGTLYHYPPMRGLWNDLECDYTSYLGGYACQVTADTSLVCTIDTPSTDDDGDSISYTFDWDVDGTAFTDTETTTETGDTVPVDALGYDETWTCKVTPNDGDEDGPYGSDSWTTDAAPPVLCTGEDQTDFSYTHFGNGTSAPAFADQRYLSSSAMVGWHNSVSSPVPAYAAIEFPTPTRVNTLRFSSACDSPRGASFEASNDSTNGVDGSWTALTSDIPSGVCGWTTVSFDNESAYTMYRMIESSGIGFVVQEWEMICDGSGDPVEPDCTEATYDGHDYLFCDESVTRDVAVDRCNSLGMNLVTVDSSAENNFLRLSESAGHAHWWLGLTRDGGSWAWDDGSSFSYDSWEAGEPNSCCDCVEYDGTGSDIGEWKSNYCDNSNNYICEAEIDADGDGYGADDDCDDSDPLEHPYAGDTHGDGVDSDCDGMDCAGGLIDGVYYVACYNPQTWNTANDICNDAGYDGLATLTSSTENDFVHDLLPTMGTGREHLYWMGFNDQASEGDWRWSSGLPVTYSRWGSGEPSDGGGGEDCGHLYGPGMPAHHGEWNDHYCSNAQSFVCEAR